MKLFPEEFDILIAHLGNDGAMARAQGDDNFADYAEKRIAKFQKAKEQQMAKEAPPNRKQSRPDAPKPPRLTTR